MRPLVLMIWPLLGAFAQQLGPPTMLERQASAEAQRLMQSPEYREKAWGAYLAGQYGLQDRASDLLSQLAALRESTAPQRIVVQATLDALIRLGSKPDSTLLMKQFPNEVLILLAQNPPAYREALLLMAEQQDVLGFRWVVANNLLVEFRLAGIATLLLSEVNISHRFSVTDGSGLPPGEGGGSGGGALCCGMPAPARDLPPVGIYDLVLTPARGDVLVAPGAHPVYYRRVTTCRGQEFLDVDRQEYRLEYLAELSGRPLGAIKQALTPSTSSYWTNASQYWATIYLSYQAIGGTMWVA